MADKQTPTPPADPKAPPSTPPAGDEQARLAAVEAEQQRQGGVLDQILSRLPGKAPAAGDPPAADPAPGGKSIAELVREGIEGLERERATAAEGEANKNAREDHDKRLKALEERAPFESAASPAGAFRAAAQRVFFGITEGRR